ncbi:MAG: amidase [Thermomicrobiales bacterium]|nr:amidase [Thermomicrobiales bacterium]
MPGFHRGRGRSIAAWLEDPYCAVDGEIAAVYGRLVDELRGAGARIDEGVRPVPLAEGHDVAQRLIQGAMSRWLPDEAFQSLLERRLPRRPTITRRPYDGPATSRNGRGNTSSRRSTGSG